MQRLYTIVEEAQEKKAKWNWNCYRTSFEVLLCTPWDLLTRKKVKALFLGGFLWQLSFWGDFLGLDPPLYVVVTLLFETRWIFWRGANKHIWQDLVRHMIAVKSRLYSPLDSSSYYASCKAMCDKYGSCGFSSSSSLSFFPTFLKYETCESCWHWKLQKLNQASGKQMVSKCSFTPSYPLFSECEKGEQEVQGQKLHKTLIILREKICWSFFALMVFFASGPM